MDFTQHNKINSLRLPNYSVRRQNFVPQVQSYSNSMQQPKFQQHVRNSSYSYQPSNFQPQNYMREQVYPGSDHNRNFFTNTATIHDPRSSGYSEVDHPFSGMAAPSNSYCSDEMITKVENYSSDSNEKQMKNDQEHPEVFEYCQCTPSLEIRKQTNPFKHVMQSMQKYSRSNTNQTPCSKGDVSPNNQTYCYTHENDSGEEAESIDYNMYKSHTKIEVIPKGLRIITEILKEENELNNSCGDAPSSCPGRQTQKNKVDWLKKKIEITVEEDQHEEEVEDDDD